MASRDIIIHNFQELNPSSFITSVKPKKKNVKSKTYLYLFLGKVYQYCILLLLLFLHDNYFPWVNYIDDKKSLENILLVLIPIVIISYFSFLFLKSRTPFNPKLSFPCLTLSTISLYILLIYLRKFNIYEQRVLYLICLLNFVISLVICLFLFCVKNNYLDIVFTFYIIGIVGTGLFCCYLYFMRHYPLLFILELSSSIVINIYMMCMCYFIYKKDEDNYNVLFFAACKCFHCFLVPILVIGIVFVMIIALFASSCNKFCDNSSNNNNNYNNYDGAQSQPIKHFSWIEEQKKIEENNYPSEINANKYQ